MQAAPLSAVAQSALSHPTLLPAVIAAAVGGPTVQLPRFRASDQEYGRRLCCIQKKRRREYVAGPHAGSRGDRLHGRRPAPARPPIQKYCCRLKRQGAQRSEPYVKREPSTIQPPGSEGFWHLVAGDRYRRSLATFMFERISAVELKEAHELKFAGRSASVTETI